MKRFTKIMLIALGFGLPAVAVGFLTSTPAPAAPNSARVTVVNTPSQPVPTVAHVTQPFHIPLCIDFGTQSGSCHNPQRYPNANSSFTVPMTTSDGHTVERMVIEYVSCSCESSGQGQSVFELLLGTVLNENSPFPAAYDAFPVATSTTSNIQIVSQQTRLYADPGSPLSLSFGGEPGLPAVDGTSCSMTLTGYLTTTTP